MINDVVNSTIVGNYITDIAGSGITVGHPQHVYLGDGAPTRSIAAGVEGICTNDTDHQQRPLRRQLAARVRWPRRHHRVLRRRGLTHHAQPHQTRPPTTASTSGWGWQNFKDSTTCKNNAVNNNRLDQHAEPPARQRRGLHARADAGHDDQRKLRQGHPRRDVGPDLRPAQRRRQRLHHRERQRPRHRSGRQIHDQLRGLRREARPDDPAHVRDREQDGREPARTARSIRPSPSPDNVWPPTQYTTCVELRHPGRVPQRSCRAALVADAGLCVPGQRARSRSERAASPSEAAATPSNAVWFAPAGTTTFTRGRDDDEGGGNATSIAVPDQRRHLQASRGRCAGQQAGRIRGAAEGQVEQGRHRPRSPREQTRSRRP